MKPTGKAVAAAAVALVQSYHSYRDMDCQAMIEEAVRIAGGVMNYRGSNHMARSAAWLGTLENAQSEGKLKPGALLFIHEEDESSLPTLYRGDGLGDFSHVGLYIGENLLTDTDKHGKRRECNIVHSSQSMGRVCGSTMKNGWTHVGWAKEINYGVEITPGVQLGMEIGQEAAAEPEKEKASSAATVRSPDGNPVKLRKSPSKGEKMYWKAADGETATVERRKGEWALTTVVCTDGIRRRAWMMSQYLEE